MTTSVRFFVITWLFSATCFFI